MLTRSALELQAAEREATATRAAKDIGRLQRALAVLTAIQNQIYDSRR